ncbi:MAG: hypothetical protein WBG58_03475, partial [Ignavibacteriaceae bacterium]
EEQIEDKILVFQKEEAVGAEITLLLKDGTDMNGELLSVRDSSITMCTKYSATEKELASPQYPIHTVRTDKIWEITLEGSNYRWIGFGIGTVAGIGLGVLVAENYESESHDSREEAYIGFCLGVLVGSMVATIGAGIGEIASTDDVILYEIPPGYKLVLLKSLARYPDEEPKYLKAIE